MRVRTILLFCLAPFAIGALQGCGGSDEPGDNNNNNGGALGACPDNADAQVMAGFDELQGKCITCHTKDKTDALSRGGAPVSVNVDDPASVNAEAEEIYERVKDGTMPPGTKLPAETVESIRIYLACEAQ
ncbi:c-type cytochrome [Sorangium sp. So ce1182]|uniref:c-type cytochrome n=1 Tax=Sorangium sp. So ce1182 TaxID=3133334 RepID=UPI003F62588F